MIKKKKQENNISSNKKAYFNYTILEKLEVGIVLTGYEVKSIRLRHISIQESYVRIDKDELYLMGAHIRPYLKAGGFDDLDPTRTRKLLAHRREINKWIGKVNQKGLTIVPLSVYFKENRVKLKIGLAEPKKRHDKRQSIKEREIKRTIDRATKSR